MENKVTIKCEPAWGKEEEAVGYECIKEPYFVSCTEPKMEPFEQDELMNDTVTSVLNIKEEVDVLEESGNELKSELEMEDHSISEHSYESSVNKKCQNEDNPLQYDRVEWGSTKDSLRHTGSKVHKCVYCGKCFPSSEELKVHVTTHTAAEKSAKSDHCGKCLAKMMTASEGCNKKVQTLTSQKKQCLLNVKEYFQREMDNSGPLIPVKNVVQRTADALKVSKSTVLRVSKKTDFVTPGKSRPHASKITGIDHFDVDAVRHHIHAYYHRGEYPTLKNLLVSLTDVGLYQGQSVKSLRKVLHNANFNFKKYGSKAVLMEKNEIVQLRVQFLRITPLLDWSKVIFLGETWVNAANPCVKKLWTTGNSQAGRLFVYHAGTINGFIPMALSLLHKEMDSTKFKAWFTKNLLPNIANGSTILMDNSPYNLMQINHAPTSFSKKDDIIRWLHANNMPCTKDLFKSELLHLVRKSKNRSPRYEIDEIALSQGHKVVRIPPNHCQYNAIELIWAQVKGYVAANLVQGSKCVEDVVCDGINSISIGNWENAVEHIKTQCEQDWVNEGVREKAVEGMILHLGPEESSDEDSTDSEGYCTRTIEDETSAVMDESGVALVPESLLDFGN